MTQSNKYLFLDDISRILGKSWSFCQKEVSSGRIVGEKKYILGKRKFVIQKEDFLNYVRNNPERVGNIKNLQENIESISKTISELESPSITEKRHQEVIPSKAQEVSISHEETKQISDNSKSITELENLLKLLQENKKEDGSSNLYTDQLLKTIEDLKIAKDEEKNEYKERILGLEENLSHLQDELRNESKKVERSFFISDRFEKSLVKQNELLLNITYFIKSLGDGKEVSLGDVKSMLASYSVNEQIIIDENTRDIKLINQPNTTFFEKLQGVDDDIVVEKSRKAEIEKQDEDISALQKSIYKKNIIIYVIFAIIIIFGIIVFLGDIII